MERWGGFSSSIIRDTTEVCLETSLYHPPFSAALLLLVVILLSLVYMSPNLWATLKMVALEGEEDENDATAKRKRVRFRNGSSLHISSSSSTLSSTSNSKATHDDHYMTATVEPPLVLLGPTVPQTMTFLVTKPPSELIPVLANGEYKPIHRQLVLHIEHRTLEIRKPTRSSTSHANGGGTTAGPSWEFHKQSKRTIVPLSHVLSVSAQVSFGCKTLELTVDQSKECGGGAAAAAAAAETVESQSHLKLMSHQVTLENWSKHHLQEEDEDFPEESSFDQGENWDFNSDIQSVGSGTSSVGSHTVMGASFSTSSGGATTLGSTLSTSTRKHHGSRKKQPTRGKTIVREYTFGSEYEASSFQTMYLVLQTVGSELIHLYNALELVHIRSDAHVGEAIDHPMGERGNEAKTQVNDPEWRGKDCPELKSAPGQTGVALDDVYKCLGEMPFLAEKIDKVYACKSETPKLDGKSKKKSLIISAADRSVSSGMELISSEHKKRVAMYRGKRRVLGFLDFVRLFVPSILEEDMPFASPTAGEGHSNFGGSFNFGKRDGIDVHQERIKRLITIRKRVAEASIRVCAYKHAMDIVHDGWILPSATPLNKSLLKRRMAFDLDHANAAHDSYAENEYYDATVGKDVQCLQSLQDGKKDTIQAFSLIGCHMFKSSKSNHNGSDSALKPSNDPIQSIPSLKHIIESNPNNDFFVLVFFNRNRVATVALFVRHLPKGIDESFDNAMYDFVGASPEERNSQLDLYIQLGESFESKHFTQSLKMFF